MVICLERGADLHMAQLMPLPLTVSCSSKIQIGFTFLVPALPGSPGKEAVKWLLLIKFLTMGPMSTGDKCRVSRGATVLPSTGRASRLSLGGRAADRMTFYHKHTAAGMLTRATLSVGRCK